MPYTRRIALTTILASIALIATAVPAGSAPSKWFTVEFSADVVGPNPLDPAKPKAIKLHVGKSALRLETQDAPKTVTIYDAVKDVTLVLDMKQKTYAEFNGSQRVQAYLPVADGNPCPQPRDQFECRRLGEETVAGRPADKWEIAVKAGPQRVSFYKWVDRQLRIVLRYQLPGGQATEVRNFRFGPQPVGLFQIPKGFKKQVP